MRGHCETPFVSGAGIKEKHGGWRKKNDAIMHEAGGNNVGEVEKKSSMKLLVASFKTS